MTEKNYAVVKDYTVVNLIVFDDPSDETLNIFKDFYDADSIVLATDNAKIDGEYDGENFWTEKPYESWLKNQEKNIWTAPVPYPATDERKPITYTWNEETLSWDELSGN
jgi:hypothetical protein